MAIIKNEIPILEYDSDQHAVIDPDHEKLLVKLPVKCVFAFLGGYIEEYAQKTGARHVANFISSTKIYPVYVTEYKGQEVALCQAPVGAAAAAQLMDWLIGYGVREIISSGCCGALEDLEEGTFLIPSRALRDEGTSYHYVAPARFIEVNPAARKAIEKCLNDHTLKYREITTWSTDGFFRETREKVEYRRSEGCSVVEMECAALAACAQFRGVVWGMILYTADSLLDIENYDERNWGGDAYRYALELCLDSVLAI